MFGWFAKTLPESFFAALKQDLEIVSNSCIFTLPVIVWLMILQRLSPKGTLSAALTELLQGNGRSLLTPCKQVREGRISAATGAYSQARQRVPVAAMRRIAERTFFYLHEISGAGHAGDLRRRLFLLDGSSIRLAHSAAITKAYAPAQNQYGSSHWPVMRVAVMHHVITGLAMVPEFGPMYGPAAVSEQKLAEALIDRLPAGSVLIADRNFGVFSVAWHAHSRGQQMLVRLTELRARHLVGSRPLRVGSEHHVTWQPSRWDLRAHPDLTKEMRIPGRLIVAQPKGMAQRLYLFVTVREPAATAVDLYKERWQIEVDLRSLKEQVRLHTLSARSPDLTASELYMAIASYNLIRAVMAEAARQINIEPRRLSFSRSQDAFWAFMRATAYVDSAEQFEHHWQILIRCLIQFKLPQRKRPPAPRLVWAKPHGFPRKGRP